MDFHNLFVINNLIFFNCSRSLVGRQWRVVPWTLSVAVTCAERIIMLVIDACKFLMDGNLFDITNIVT